MFPIHDRVRLPLLRPLQKLFPQFAHFYSCPAEGLLAIPDFESDAALPSTEVPAAEVLLRSWNSWRLSRAGHDGAFLARFGPDLLIAILRGEEQEQTATVFAAARRGHANELASLSSNWSVSPVFAGATIIGTLARRDGGESSLRLLEAEREGWAAEEVIHRLIERGDPLVEQEDHPMYETFLARGYQPGEGKWQQLISPTRRSDLIESATAALLNLRTRRVLIGKRLVGSYPGMFGFSGGKVEKGENLCEAAVRELEEETGIALPLAVPAVTSRHYSGYPKRKKAYRIHNFVFLTTEEFAAKPSAEIECRWLPIEECMLQPMGAATRQILRNLAGLLTPASGSGGVSLFQ